MTCAQSRSQLSPYLDGELSTGRRCELLRHLQDCPACERRMGELRGLGEGLRRLAAPLPPPDLGLRLRVAASHYAVRYEWLQLWELRARALVRSLAVPVTAGMMGALCLFAFMYGSVGRAVMNGTVADVPLPLSSPPRLMASGPVNLGAAVLVEADIDAFGRVDSYRLLSGPADQEVISRLNNALLLSVFQPAMLLGEPRPGQVVLAFDSVTVRVPG